jgi:O-antigen/teichoic acid export membrane protein
LVFPVNFPPLQQVLGRLTRSSLFRWSAVYTVLNVCIKLLRLLAVTYIAIHLTPEEYGRFGLAFSLVTAIGAFGCAGLVERTVEQLGHYGTPQRQRILFRRQIGLMIVNVVVWALVLTTLFWRGFPGADTVLIISAAALMGMALAAMTHESFVLRQKNQMARSVFLLAAAGGGVSIGLIIAATLGGELPAIMWGGAIGAWAGFALAFRGDWPAVRLPPLASLPSEFRTLFPYYLVALVGWLSGYGLSTVVASVFDVVEVANYTFLFTLSVVLQVLGASMNSVWAPEFYRLHNSGETELAERRAQFVYKCLAAIMTVAACLVLLMLPLITWAAPGLGPYLDEPLKLAMLLVGYVLLIPVWHANNYMYVTKSRQALLWSTVLPTLIGLPLLLVLAYTFGDLWLYVGYAIWSLLRGLTSFAFMRRTIEISPPWGWLMVATACIVLVGVFS